MPKSIYVSLCWLNQPQLKLSLCIKDHGHFSEKWICKFLNGIHDNGKDEKASDKMIVDFISILEVYNSETSESLSFLPTFMKSGMDRSLDERKNDISEF